MVWSPNCWRRLLTVLPFCQIRITEHNEMNIGETDKIHHGNCWGKGKMIWRRVSNREPETEMWLQSIHLSYTEPQLSNVLFREIPQAHESNNQPKTQAKIQWSSPDSKVHQNSIVHHSRK
jgi:hypothetical protein